MMLTSLTLHCQNISVNNVTQFYLVLDDVNQSYLALSKYISEQCYTVLFGSG